VSPSRDSVVAGLQSLMGHDRVATDTETLAKRSLDTWPLPLVQLAMGAQPAAPLCVVRPRSTDEVARVLAHLYRQGVPTVPYGGGSGVLGGAKPGPDSVVLDLGEMSRILSLDEDNLTVTVQPGVFLGKLEAWLNERGYITGHYPQSIDVAQLGGLVATRSAGQFSTKYGNIEDLLVSLEAVLPDGQVMRIKDVPRRATGPDLRHIWLGSEGAFGVITEVTVKVFPRPVDRWLQAYAVPTMRTGMEVIHRFLHDGWRPAVVRLHDEIEAERSYASVVNKGESILLLLSEGPEGYAQAEGRALDRTALAAGLHPLGPAPVEAWLEHRNDVHEFEQFIRAGLIVDTIEVSARWTDIAGIYERVAERLRREVPELIVVSGHSSHSYPQGTNLYFSLGAQPPRNPAEVERVYKAIWSRVMETTLAGGGTISHHHGVGKMRAPWMPAELGTSYKVLESLKSALDPKGLMNPGTLLPLSGQEPPRP